MLLRVLALDLPPVAAGGAVQLSRWQPARALPYLETDEQDLHRARRAARRGARLHAPGSSDHRECPGSSASSTTTRSSITRPAASRSSGWPTRPPARRASRSCRLASFAVFFGSAMLLGWIVFTPARSSTERPISAAGPRRGAVHAGRGSRCTPIMAHVAGRLWLDGPLLAFSTAGAAVFLLSVRRRSTLLACVAAVLLGYASLIKVTAFLVVPGVAALAWAITPRSQYRGLLGRGVLLLALAGTIQLPWEIWQWAVVGSPFPGWAGKPRRGAGPHQPLRPLRHCGSVTLDVHRASAPGDLDPGPVARAPRDAATPARDRQARRRAPALDRSRRRRCTSRWE